MTRVDFIKTLKVGDRFKFIERYGFARRYSRVSELFVKRFTATQLVCIVNAVELRFRLSSGARIGGNGEWFPTPATDEEIKKVNLEERNSELACMLRDFRWAQLDTETLEQVVSLVSKAKAVRNDNHQ